MARERRQERDGDGQEDQAEARHREEWNPPTAPPRQLQPRGDAEDRRDGKRAHHRPERLAAALGRNDIGHDRQGEGGGGASEEAGEDARQDHAAEPDRQAAQRRGHDQPGDRESQRLAAIEPVEEEGAGDPGHRSSRGVAAADHADARRRDAQRPGEKRAERQHHHEIEDVDELDRADEEDDGPLAGLPGH